jgi:hypothetical protein
MNNGLTKVSVFIIIFTFFVAFLPITEAAAEEAEPDSFQNISVSGSISIIPVDNWSSGNFSQLMSVINPISAGELEKHLYIDMDSTATTIYEGDIWFGDSGLTMGFKLDLDDNFIGKFNSILGYIGYNNYSIRMQTSSLRGDLTWKSDYTVPDMPDNFSFDNRFVTIDLIYYPDSQGSDFYLGLGYTSYELPVQLDCLVVNELGNIVYGNHVYQPDMKFRIYSFLFGFDTLHSAYMEVDSIMNTGDGFGAWLATQDRFGFGFSEISSQAETWIESANPGRELYDDKQFTMMVDYNLILGIRWVGNSGPARIGAGMGYSLGGQTIIAISSSFKPISKQTQVTASPDLYLFHHGLILKLTASW